MGDIPKTARCELSDTYDKARLKNDEYDVCLEDNPSVPISDDLVEVIPGTKTQIEDGAGTWYANGFQWRGAKNEEIFSTYDYVVAMGSEYTSRYPPGSLIRITIPETGKSVIAKVIDRKPRGESLDMSKAVAYALGGYKLLARGRCNPVIEAVRIKPASGASSDGYMVSGYRKGSGFDAGGIEKQYRQNVFFRLGHWKYHESKKNIDAYLRKNEAAFAAYWNLSRYLKDNVPEYNGWPRPHLTIVHQFDYNPKTKTTKNTTYLQLRFGPFHSEHEEILFYKNIKPLVDDKTLPELTEVGERWPSPFNVRIHRDDRFVSEPPAVFSAFDNWKNCVVKLLSLPYPAPVAKQRIANAFDIDPGCIQIEIPYGWSKRPYLVLGGAACFKSEKEVLNFLKDLLPVYVRTVEQCGESDSDTLIAR